MLMPPPNARYWTGPNHREKAHAPLLTTWTVILDHGGDEGPRWEITGRDLVYPEGDRERRTLGLLHVDTHGEYARTTMGWIRLGRRHYS